MCVCVCVCVYYVKPTNCPNPKKYIPFGIKLTTKFYWSVLEKYTVYYDNLSVSFILFR